MIHDEKRLGEVLDEISAWSLQARREYIAEMEKAFGAASAEQIKQALTEFWKERK